jgi:hypothetical protein
MAAGRPSGQPFTVSASFLSCILSILHSLLPSFLPALLLSLYEFPFVLPFSNFVLNLFFLPNHHIFLFILPFYLLSLFFPPLSFLHFDVTQPSPDVGANKALARHWVWITFKNNKTRLIAWRSHVAGTRGVQLGRYLCYAYLLPTDINNLDRGHPGLLKVQY